MLKPRTVSSVTVVADKSATRGSFVSVGPPATPSGAGDLIPSVVCLGLTARQRDVLAVMMQGKSNKAICRVLNLAEPTVKNHVTAILKVLKVSNRTEAVIKVARASVASTSYHYTISGQSTFLPPVGDMACAWPDHAFFGAAEAPAVSSGRFNGLAFARARNNP